MHKVLKAFPCSFDGIRAEDLKPGDEREFGSMAEGLKRAGLIGEPDETPNGTGALREDGPTVAEYVAAGYLASQYPPKGYASRSTAEEIEAAVAAADAEKALEAMRADLAKQTVAQLQDIAKAESVAIETDDKKGDVIDKIMAARAAPAE